MKLLVLGVGNVMFMDEGIGVHLCKLLERNYSFHSKDHTIEFVDGGTLAMRLIPIMAEFDSVLLLDCIDATGGEVGDVYFFDYKDMPKNLSWSGSAHEIEMLQTLKFMEIAGDLPRTKIIGIIPKRIEEPGFEISDEIKAGVSLMEKTALKYLKELGFSIEKKDNKTIQEMADEFK
ncbi:HyaD/HybD family hydrogenase maturation endopeptidase [uncultured Campylobacter sp.]|uniref:HyaD/HybD family hydrogenase maturation endopeptidase n=1 Tax=uncultured Campylobacter sp. TaxID=218934 RepID=UPI00263534CF|nr:HyaD/HybD family hydrogenase maturation endopeptidase [uncultured Campylobacter sp.]